MLDAPLLNALQDDSNAKVTCDPGKGATPSCQGFFPQNKNLQNRAGRGGWLPCLHLIVFFTLYKAATDRNP